MIRIAIPTLALAAALASIEPADACHRFHTWRYPYPQRCRAPGPVRLAEDRSWTVEITKAPSPSPAPTPATPPTPPPAPSLEDDQRTPEQIKDFTEHQIELVRHHDEINNLMILLHTEEDAHRAAGLQWPPR